MPLTAGVIQPNTNGRLCWEPEEPQQAPPAARIAAVAVAARIVPRAR